MYRDVDKVRAKNRHDDLTRDSDHSYYNVVMDFDSQRDSNFPHKPIPAIYNVQPSQPILLHPRDYWLSVVRFQIPGQLIPLYYEVGYNGGDPNLTFKSVTISVAGVDAQVFLRYVPQDNTIPVPSPPITNNNIDYYAVRSYQQLVDEINVALAAAFALNPAIPVLVPALVAPYMIYNPVTQLFSLIADQRFATIPIEIFFNSDLYIFFQPSFDVIKFADDDVLGKDYQILIKNNNNNNYIPSPVVPGISFYQMEQEAKSINNITAFKTIVITVGNIPIKYEATPTQAQFSQYNQIPILTDFLPFLSNNAGDLQTYITYYPSGQYRYSDLIGDNPIERLLLQVFWGDKYENLHPLLIPAHSSANLKIMFQRKDIYTGK